MHTQTLVIIPAFNEEKTIEEVILQVKQVGFKNILVVDDGSTDKTRLVAQNSGARVLSHLINIGLGGALATGFDFAREKNFNFAITMDADGQHLPSDALEIEKALKTNCGDLVIGSRIDSLWKKYKKRFVINFLSNIFTYILSGLWVSDSQSGLRGLNKNALEKIKPTQSGYEVSSEIIILAKANKIKVWEIPINAIYSKYSLEKGQKIQNAFNVFRKLLLN